MVLAENRQFHKFIILTMMLLFPHDYAIDWNTLGGSRARRFTRARRVCPGRVDLTDFTLQPHRAKDANGGAQGAIRPIGGKNFDCETTQVFEASVQKVFGLGE